MAVKRYWISFDLGLQGDYRSLYKWLDEHEAEECGDNIATVRSGEDREQIARDISTILLNQRQARVYVIDIKNGGKFILGRRRKSPPWRGFAEVESSEAEI